MDPRGMHQGKGRGHASLSANQLPLPLGIAEDELRAFLEKSTGGEVSLTLTDNSSSMLSVRERSGRLYVRIHHMFLCAGSEVLRELARFIRTRKGSTPLVMRFIREHSRLIKSALPRRRARRPARGRFHDLGELFRRLNAEYFGGRVKCEIAWGSGGGPGRGRVRTLGCYCTESHSIRINPALDRRSVPAYYVEFVVYHEMLHADMGVGLKNGRRVIHPRGLKERERIFKHYERATAWERTRGVSRAQPGSDWGRMK